MAKPNAKNPAPRTVVRLDPPSDAPAVAPPVAPTPDHVKQKIDIFGNTGHANGSVEQPSHAEIAGRAYDIYLKSGGQPNHCDENWSLAEQSLLAQASVRQRRAPRNVQDGSERPLPDPDLPSDDLGHAPLGRSGWAAEPRRSTD